jgi:hypothetical protein
MNTNDFKKEAWKGVNAPPELKRCVEHIAGSYGINGICDYGYIANTIAKELGIGDGKGHFFKYTITTYHKG